MTDLEQAARALLEKLHREAPRYGLFVCHPCRDGVFEECGDSCCGEWPDDLSPTALFDADDDYRALCRCCGLPASLVSPLVPLA